MTRTALIVFQTVVLLVLAEGAARVAERLHPPSEDLTFDYAPYRMLRMTGAPWALNRDGFRAKEWNAYRNTFLIEFLGGSVCLGVGANPGRTLPERLEDALHRAGLEKAAVLNLCQGGATSGQELAIFIQYGLPLRPQVVLSFDGANDLLHPSPVGTDEAPNLPYKNAEIRGLFAGHHSIAAHLAMVRVAARLRSRGKQDSPPSVPPGSAVPVDAILDSYFYATDVARTLTEAQGGMYAILLQPSLHFEKPWSLGEKKMWMERLPRGGEEVSRRAREIYAAAAARLRSRADAREQTRELTGKTQEKTREEAAVFDLTQVFAQTPETIYSDSVHFQGGNGYAMLEAEVERQGLVERIAARYRVWSRRAVVETAKADARQVVR